jgi:hypothetical protein
MIEWFYKRFSLNEVSGAFGDIGTVISITLAMAKVNAINISSSFFWYGINNIFLSYYDLPITVQPQKTISALAIKGELDKGGVICAGFLTGIITSFLALTGTLTKVAYLIPKHLISVIQMSQGLIFVTQGVKDIVNVNKWIGCDSYLTSIIVGLFIVLTWNSKNSKIPTALIIFIVGLIIAGSTYTSSTQYTVLNPFIYTNLSGKDFLEGFKATFTQLPLTLLNSVISTIELAHSLFPENKLTINNISYTIGLINVPTFIGGTASCLGCGALASNYKFQGKTGLVPVIIGFVYIAFSIFFGSILIDLLSFFPNSILGIMLMVSGGQLALEGSKKLKEHHLDYCICVGICLATNLYTGFLTGIFLHMLREILSKKETEELQNLTQIEIN